MLSRLSFPFYVARRYLFSRKSHNVVNIISGISSGGIAIGAMAMICVLSVFNGIDRTISDMFSAFDPELKITAVKGKTFSIDSPAFEALQNSPNVAVFSETIEENALLTFRQKQMPVTIKGVDETKFHQLTLIDSIMYDGEFMLHDGGFYRIVPGIGVAISLGLGAHFIDPVYIHAPKRTARINVLRPEKSLNSVGTYVSGIFMVEQLQYDDSYTIISIDQARELFEYDNNTVSAVELKLAEGINQEQAKKEIQRLLGNDYSVKDRYEQQESFYKIMKMEKWLAYFILSFILLIASFNIIGSLSMLIIDKKADIDTLRNLGANHRLIKRIFLFEGWLISIVGAVGGIILGLIICLIQQQFGLLKMGNSYLTEAYPVVINMWDTLLVFATVLIMGFVASYYPVRYISNKKDLSEK
ncbi:ABC transporter permease [Paludibacter sp. 221]|nr:ABC transporter permease [Paludibacter sp. 221]